MNQQPAEVFPRISKAEIQSAKKLHKGVHLSRLVKLLQAMGIFGPGRISNRTISHRIYETHEVAATKHGDNRPKVEYDPHAEDRFENIVYKNYALIEREIGFFRTCLARAFGDEATSELTDDEICAGHPTLLVRKLLSGLRPLDFGSVDPLVALMSMAMATDQKPDVQLVEERQTSRRNVQLDDNFVVDFDVANVVALAPGTEFKLYVPKSQSRSKPLVINFPFATGLAGKPNQPKYIDYRGQMLEHVVPTDDGDGPWRISMRDNKPLKLGPQSGRYGFLVISDFSGSYDQLFPDDFDERALCDDDYRHLYTALANVLATGQSSKLGLLLYDVHA